MQVYDIVFIATTPLCAVSIFFLCSAFLSERITTKKVEITSYIIYCTLLSAIFVFTRIPTIFLAFNILGIFLISLNYYARFTQRLVYTLLVYTAMLVVEAIVWRLMGFFEIQAFIDSDFNSVAGILLNRIITLILSRLLYRNRKTTPKIYPVPAYYYIAHMLILAGTVYMFALSLEKEILTMGQVLVSGLVMIIVNGMIIFLDETIYRSIASIHENAILIQQNQAYEKQTELMNQTTSTIRGLKHDMKNHILVMQAIQESNHPENFNTYANKLLEEIDGTHHFINSGNFVVDSIVNFKVQALQSEDVEIRLNIDVPTTLEILPFDLTTLIGNLLDNAITAVTETAGRKLLTVHMDCNKGSFVLLLDNSHNGNVMINQGRFQSTKKDAVTHGIGLARIEEMVNKYDGTLQIDYTDELFSVAVIIPLSECDT